MQKEGLRIPSAVFTKMEKQHIWIWRLQSDFKPLSPISIDRYLSELAVGSSIRSISNAEKKIQIIDLEDASVNRGLFAEKSGEIIPISSYSSSEISRELPILGPFLDLDSGVRFVKPRNSIDLASGVFAGFNPNYYHFTWEIFPKLVYFYEKNLSKGVPTILSRNSPNSISEMVLEISGIDPVLVGDDQFTCVQRLYLLHDSRYVSPVDFTSNTQSNIFSDRRDDLDRIRAMLSTGEFEDPENTRAKIFVGRPDSDLRVPSNLDHICEILGSKGFHQIRPELMSFRSQVSVFREAEEICILAGAAVTNLMYCKNLRRVIILIVDLSSLSAWKFWQDYCSFLDVPAIFLYAGDSKRGFGPISIVEINNALA